MKFWFGIDLWKRVLMGLVLGAALGLVLRQTLGTDAAAANVKNLSGDLRPIVDDIRVFSDKIARHPESLGVRGALDRRPGLK